jgi:hypothetical protein
MVFTFSHKKVANKILPREYTDMALLQSKEHILSLIKPYKVISQLSTNLRKTY